jgi:hypothetical protein
MATSEMDRRVYAAEQERYLAQARRNGLFSDDDARRMMAAYRASEHRTSEPPGSVLPRLLLESQEGGVLELAPSTEQAGARWSLYERIREQTRAGASREPRPRRRGSHL